MIFNQVSELIRITNVAANLAFGGLMQSHHGFENHLFAEWASLQLRLWGFSVMLVYYSVKQIILSFIGDWFLLLKG